MNKLITIALILIATISNAQQSYTKYLILNESEYLNINMTISEAKGYDINDRTERVFPMNAAKYCIVDSTLKIALAINPENQIYVDTTLLLDINEIVFKDTTISEITIDKSDQKAYNWFAKHYEKVGDKSKKWFWVDKDINKEKAPKEIQDKTKVK